MSAADRPLPACDSPEVRLTSSLLGYGAIAGPFYTLVALAQAFTRPGFDLLHDDVSLLANGPLGWIQGANFALTGLMVLACAVGMRRALKGEPGGTWGPWLLGVYGLGLVGAGFCPADPMNGFPPGTPAGMPATVSTHGILHIVTAAVGFSGLIAACFVFARRFGKLGRRGWALASFATGLLFFAGFAGVASGSSSAAVVVAFWIALLAAWSWLAALSIQLFRRVRAAG